MNQGNGLGLICQTDPGLCSVIKLHCGTFFFSQLKPIVKLSHEYHEQKAEGEGLAFFQYLVEQAGGQKPVGTQSFLTDYQRMWREAPFSPCKHEQLQHKHGHGRDSRRAEMRPAEICAQSNLILGYHRLPSVMRWL